MHLCVYILRHYMCRNAFEFVCTSTAILREPGPSSNFQLDGCIGAFWAPRKAQLPEPRWLKTLYMKGIDGNIDIDM